jgi:hypothetical protein
VRAAQQETREANLFIARQFASPEDVAPLKYAVSTLDMVFQPQHTEVLKKCIGKPQISYRNPGSSLEWNSNVMIPANWGMETSSALRGDQI